jgi:hypothetical protein
MIYVIARYILWNIGGWICMTLFLASHFFVVEETSCLLWLYIYMM